jgi:methyltransferase, FkbM family
MSSNYEKELFKLVRAKKLVNLLPEKLKLRAAKYLYDYTSKEVTGIDMLAETKHGIKCLVNTKDLIGWSVFFFGEYEKTTNAILEKYVKEGDYVVEAGANIGTETLLLSKYVGAKGKVYAFEPSPYVYERLSCNTLMNTVNENVVTSSLALGEADTEITFYIFPKVYHNSGLSGKGVDWKDAFPIQVQQMTLDSWVEANNIDKINFLKMDVQGAEPDILRGGTKSIDRFKPTVFMEAHEHLDFLFDFFNSRGYKIYMLKGGMELLDQCPTIKGDWLAIYEG